MSKKKKKKNLNQPALVQRRKGKKKGKRNA